MGFRGPHEGFLSSKPSGEKGYPPLHPYVLAQIWHRGSIPLCRIDTRGFMRYIPVREQIGYNNTKAKPDFSANHCRGFYRL